MYYDEIVAKRQQRDRNLRTLRAKMIEAEDAGDVVAMRHLQYLHWCGSGKFFETTLDWRSE